MTHTQRVGSHEKEFQGVIIAYTVQDSAIQQARKQLRTKPGRPCTWSLQSLRAGVLPRLPKAGWLRWRTVVCLSVSWLKS